MLWFAAFLPCRVKKLFIPDKECSGLFAALSKKLQNVAGITYKNHYPR